MTRSMYSTWKIELAERLGRSVVDLLGEAGALRLLGLDDAHLDVALGRRRTDLGDEGGVAALEEQPGPLEGPFRELQLGQLGLPLADVDREGLDVAAERPSPEVVGACLGGVRGAVHRGRRGSRPGEIVGAAVLRIELVAQRLPVGEGVGVGLAVALAHAAERVRAVADRRLRLRVESVEATVPCIGTGACWLHR